MLLGLRSAASLLVLVSILGAQGYEHPLRPRTDEGGASSAEGEAGTGFFEARLGFYNHADSGGSDGNPFVDEELTIIEPILIYDYQVSADLGIGVDLSYDFVSSASIERLDAFPEQSGASRDNYIGAGVSLRHGLSDTSRLDWHLSASTEYDYNSIGIGAKYQWEPADTNSTLSFALDGFFDTVDIIRFDGVEEGDDDRTTFSGTFRWYQVLSPTSFGELGLTVAQQNGFLETAYNEVNTTLSPPPVTEELPDERLRIALFGRTRWRLKPGRAVELGGRFYTDDWGIDSFTIEPAWYETLVEDSLDLRLRYRGYLQSDSKYFQDTFASAPEFRTQDPDLGDFDAHTLGAKFIWYATERSTLDWSLDYTLRSDGLDAVFTSIGWNFKF